MLLILIKLFLIAVQAFMILFLLQPFILLCIYFFRRFFKIREPQVTNFNKHNYQFGIIITAHIDPKFISPIIDSLLKQTYKYFQVYVVADGCDINEIPVFEDSRIHILKPPIALNTNTKSIEFALQNFSKDDEVMVLFDPDNLVHPNFLEVLNTYYNRGFQAVQGNLYAKNIERLYEKMDSIGVVFNNFIDREVRSELNLSVNTWGCGVSIKTELYRTIIYDSRCLTGGFDKYMQIELAKKIPRLAYAKEAILFDEKVNNSISLENQRIRWINSYFKFLPDAFLLFLSGIKKLNFNVAFFGYNLVRPPYFLQILIAFTFIVFNYMIDHILFQVWAIVLLLFLLSFIAIILIKRNDSLLIGLLFMPLFFYHQIRSFLKINLNKNSILKTENSKVVYIDELLKHKSF